MPTNYADTRHDPLGAARARAPLPHSLARGLAGHSLGVGEQLPRWLVDYRSFPWVVRGLHLISSVFSPARRGGLGCVVKS